MSRPHASVFLASSVDGFIARVDGGIDWLALVERPDEDYGISRNGVLDRAVPARPGGHPAPAA